MSCRPSRWPTRAGAPSRGCDPAPGAARLPARVSRQPPGLGYRRVATVKARAAAAKANEQLQGAIGRIGTSSAMAAFERMEDKVLQMEARSQAAAELAGSDLERQFAMLEGGSDVDDELAAMKAQLTGAAPPQALPSSGQSGTTTTSTTSSSSPSVDKDLEELRKQLDQL